MTCNFAHEKDSCQSWKGTKAIQNQALCTPKSTMIYCFAPPRTIKIGLLEHLAELQSGYMPNLCTEFTSPEAMERLGHEGG
jgi:hypothetical protein